MRFLTIMMFLFFVAAQSTVYADQIKFLQNDSEAISARLKLIQYAQKEILVEYFSVTDDDISTTGIALLCDASRRGVKVKILLDSLSSSVKIETMYATTEMCTDKTGKNNLEFKLFNPINIRQLSKIFYRTHEKLLIVDSEKMITGGRNVDHKYFGLDRKRNFDDLDIFLKGENVAHARNYLFTIWNRTDVSKVPNYINFNPKFKGSCRENEGSQKCLYEINIENARIAKIRIENLLEKFKSKSDYSDAILEEGFTSVNADKVQLLTSNPERDIKNDDLRLSNQLLEIFSKAEKKVLILSPYLIPNVRVKELFKKLIEKNVHITIITNSLKSTDNLFAQAGFKSEKEDLIKMGIELYEYNMVDTTHAKTAVIDDEVALIGTFNLDPRSSMINREVGIKIVDKDIAANLNSIIEDFKSRSINVGRDGLVINENKIEGISPIKKLGVEFIKIFVPIIKKQL